MAAANPLSISQHFADLEEPRHEYYISHRLDDLLTIAICAVICGADDWVAVAAFGQAKQEWLRQFLALPHGIPSHDTFGRVFARLDPEGFQGCFIEWVQAVSELSEGEIVPIDGKTVRRSYDHRRGQGAIHLVKAWANQAHLALGQVKVDDKSNEITAIPALLELLALQGCIVTLDAMGTQKEIARQIRAKEADYVLALKENQGKLYREVVDLFATARQTDGQDIATQTYAHFNKGHGRLERRQCWTIDDPRFIAYLDPHQQWTDLQSVVMVEAQRTVKEQTSIEPRYYLSSLSGDPQRLLQATRHHWGIENKLHWVLDVAFGEDDCRLRVGHGPQNLALLRQIALNLLHQETSLSCGIQNKRLRAGWDTSYMEQILAALT